MIKRIVLIIFMTLTALQMWSQSGFDLKVKFKQPIKENSLLLGKFFGSTTLKFDTATIDKDGYYRFKKTDSIEGGIYFIVFNNLTKRLDFLLDNGYSLDIEVDTLDVIKKSTIKGSKDNDLMMAFHHRDADYRIKNEQAKSQLSLAKNEKDSTEIINKLNDEREKLLEINRASVKENPNTFYAMIANAMDRPTPPKGPHYKEDGKTIDSFFVYRFTKNNYWDKVDFTDNRLAHTPIYEEKLKDYFDNYVYPVPDSVQYEADILLAFARQSPDLFKFTLHWLGYYTRTKKIMGMDEVFVHLVEEYYSKGDAVWLDSVNLKTKYLDPAEDMSYTKLGKVGQNLELSDAYTFITRKLHDVDADYIVLIFWDPECGFCKTELPAMDSTYHTLPFKDKKIVFYSVPQSNNLESIHKAIEKMKLKKDYWTHNIPTKQAINFKKLYNVKSSPTILILDRSKKIIAKQIDHKALELVIKKDLESKK